MRAIFTKYLKGDKAVWMLCFLFGMISILAVYSSISSLAYKYAEGNTFYYLFKHGIMVLSGFAIMYGIHKVHFKYYSKLSQYAIWVAGGLLILTLLLGVNLNDASRWLKIPIINQNFQTSDFAKIVLVTYVARLLVLKADSLKSLQYGLLPILLPIVIICGLIFPANFSTAVMLFLVCMVMLFLGGIPIKHLLLVAGVAVSGLAFVIMVGSSFPDIFPRAATWKSRLVNFDSGDSQANYQIEHAMMAIQSGGIFPDGPGTGDSRNYLPHPYSDMIYAFIIEEYGMILGGCGLLLLYLILFLRAVKIARACQRDFGTLLVLGLSFLIVCQAFTNMAVAVNLMPVTGQPLPLVSMGGTSIWFTCLAIGMILSVSRDDWAIATKPKPASPSVQPISRSYATS